MVEGIDVLGELNFFHAGIGQPSDAAVCDPYFVPGSDFIQHVNFGSFMEDKKIDALFIRRAFNRDRWIKYDRFMQAPGLPVCRYGKDQGAKGQREKQDPGPETGFPQEYTVT
jgi:hypothetical protein